MPNAKLMAALAILSIRPSFHHPPTHPYDHRSSYRHSPGFVLILWSTVSFFISDSKSFTAFIPAVFGLLIAISGLIAIKETTRKHAMHVAALVGLLGLLGGFGMGLRKLFSDPGLAAFSQVFLGIVCLIFLIVCIRSFIAARRARES